MPSSIPIMNTIGNSRPLALCIVISVTQALVVADRVRVGDQRRLLQELAERAAVLGRVHVELAGRGDQLVEVLEPALGLDRPLGPQRVPVPGLVQQLVEQLRDRPPRLRALAQPAHRVHEARERLARRGREPGTSPSAASHTEIPSAAA